MASLPMSTIQHFTHQHSLTLFDSNTKYLCDGCKIPGIGKRYRCSECDFDLHEYCGICPMNLSSFLHPHHSLKLVNRKPHGERQLDRFCNICFDSPEGLFYRCEACDFDFHPLCTQLPQTLRHVLHQVHPLRLLSSTEPGTCAVCRGACNASSWRYRCALCGFDIHIDCVLIQCEKRATTDRGVPTYVPPSTFGGYAYGIPYWHPTNSNNPYFPSPLYMHHNHMSQPQHQHHGQAQTPYWHPTNYNNPYFPSPLYMHNNHMSQPQHQHHGQAQTHYGGGRIGQLMFNLVQTLGIGVFSNMIFGTDTSLFVAG